MVVLGSTDVTNEAQTNAMAGDDKMRVAGPELRTLIWNWREFKYISSSSLRKYIPFNRS